MLMGSLPKVASKNQGLAKQMRSNLRDFSRDGAQDKDQKARITHRTTDYHQFKAQ